MIDLTDMDCTEYNLTVEHGDEYYNCLPGNQWLSDKVQLMLALHS